jgi:hypothetical protein
MCSCMALVSAFGSTNAAPVGPTQLLLQGTRRKHLKSVQPESLFLRALAVRSWNLVRCSALIISSRKPADLPSFQLTDNFRNRSFWAALRTVNRGGSFGLRAASCFAVSIAKFSFSLSIAGRLRTAFCSATAAW